MPTPVILPASELHHSATMTGTLRTILGLLLLAGASPVSHAQAVPASTAGEPFIAGWARQSASAPRLPGTVLISELGCAACHATTRPEFAPKPGPDLSAVGARVQLGHFPKFLADPSGAKPGTTMPGVLGHLPEARRSEAAQAIAHYLASLGDDRPPAPPRPGPEAVERGHRLYHSVGCVACHSPESPLPDSVPLGPLEEKYSLASLTQFLEDPLAVRPGGRMPDLHLDHFEAQDLASYLLRKQGAPAAAFTLDASLVRRGRELFGEHRCGACHAVAGVRATPPLPRLESVRAERGCLSGKPGDWPQYPLSEAQRGAIRAALAAPADPWGVEDKVHLVLTRLNCLACHTRGELGGIPADRNPHFTGRDENLGDQGRLPPPLTGVGAKLKAGWLREVVVQGASVRPYLHTRMPRFGADNTGELAGWLKELDRLPPAAITRVEERDKPREVGRELAGSQGFNCVACHTFREKSAAAIRALDLMSMAARLEENWFHHYLARPQRFSPLTIMPDFWPDGKSPLPAVLGGDPGRQRDALWQYLDQGPEASEPRGLVLEPMVVAVTNEAVIIRRAFPGIGKRGIGVGYPAGIHLAFDAGQMRLGSVWSGGFIEASGLWRGQGAGQARLLGRDTVNFPPGVAFAVLDSPESAWPTNTARQAEGFAFRGYSLDARQRPTFRYGMGGMLVEDTFLDQTDGAGKPYLVRSLVFPGQPPSPGLHFRVAVAARIEAREDHTFAVGDGLRVRLPAGARIRDAAGARELLLPVAGPFTLEYHLTGKP